MRRRLVDALRWLVFAAVVLVMNFPVLSTLITSLKSDAEISASASLWIEKPTLDNYRAIFAMQDRFDILHFLLNSLIASLIGSALAILLAFPAAYAMMRFGVARCWLWPLVANLRTIPLVIFAIPIYLMCQRVGLPDTRLGLALILALVNVPLALALFSTAISELQIEIEEAARVDGAGTLRLLIHVVAPMSLSIGAATAVLAFICSWNTNRATPVSVGASFFFAASGGGVRWGVAAAVMILATLPPLLLGLGMYRQIGRSMTAGAVKG
jgi:multiple sugar transport system permease protein